MSAEWAQLTLRDLLEPVKRPKKLASDESYSTLGVRLYGNGAFKKPPLAGSAIAAKTLNEVRAGDVVYSKLFAWRGAFAVVRPDLDGDVASSEFPTYRATDALLPEFFRLWASRAEVWATAELACTGTTAASRNRLSPDDFLDLEIELPPLDEQKSIVAAVATVDGAFVTAQRRARHLDAMFRAGATELFADLDAPDQRLGDVTTLSSGGTPSRANPANYGGQVPWVKTGEVRFNRIQDTEEHLTEQGLASSSAKLLPAGTVLLAMYGQGATRGRCALLLREMATNQACAAILPDERLLPEYVFFFLWSRYEAIRAESEGSAQDNLNQGMVADIELPVPALKAQEDVVRTLSTLRGSFDAQAAEVEALRRFRGALVEDLCTGMFGVTSQAG